MTVNERLFEAKMFEDFDDAVKKRDKEKMIAILTKVGLSIDDANKCCDSILSNPMKYGYKRNSIKFILQIFLFPLSFFFVFGYLSSYELSYPCINRYHFIYLLLFIITSYFLLKLKANKLNYIILLTSILLLITVMVSMTLYHLFSAGICFKF